MFVDMQNKLISSKEEKLLLSAKDVSQMLSLGLSTVYAYIDSGHLHAISLPAVRNNCSKATVRNKRSLRFLLADVQEFVHNCKR